MKTTNNNFKAKTYKGFYISDWNKKTKAIYTGDKVFVGFARSTEEAKNKIDDKQKEPKPQKELKKKNENYTEQLFY